ncbi:glycerophosphodiester phosphodiesterase [Gordonia otitidis]|uniref:glycerophosphodiester phosphodiesterase n=1 Tax=Gordonia otitidis TaxID=249058 RepID=UPI001D1384A7|nr:glycerophosphodiester phosphodiesterase family protein [Gordonia otitidis]UEA60228.1 glycerophosphodiester phosphodiesterase [Gordonia otitidis]
MSSPQPSAASSPPPISVSRDGRRTTLKWHRARRRPSDTPFTASRIVEALRVGASVEVDLVIHADRGFALLHDRDIAQATTGHGNVAQASASYLRGLSLRDATGTPTHEKVVLLEDLAALLENIDVADDSMLQLDFKEDAAALDEAAVEVFAAAVTPFADNAILSCGDADAVRILCDAAPGIHVGYDPCHHGAIGRVLRSGDFRGFVFTACRDSPRAEMIYLDQSLVLAAADRGADLIAAFHAMQRRVDAYTLGSADATTLAQFWRLVERGADQITTDDPEGFHAAGSVQPN